MKANTAKTVEDYIGKAPERARPILRELREIIKQAVPGVEESVSWNVPFYHYHGPLAGLSVAKNHAALGVNGYVTDETRQEFEQLGFAVNKKTIQIRFGQEVPAELIKKLIKAIANDNEQQS